MNLHFFSLKTFLKLFLFSLFSILSVKVKALIVTATRFCKHHSRCINSLKQSLSKWMKKCTHLQISDRWRSCHTSSLNFSCRCNALLVINYRMVYSSFARQDCGTMVPLHTGLPCYCCCLILTYLASWRLIRWSLIWN